MESIVPLRTMMRQGVPVCIGADVPAFPSHLPLESIRCAMDRRAGSGRQLDTAEAVSFLEVLRMHTAGGAYAAFDEDSLGTLAPGKLADLAVWNKDLRKIASGADLADLEAVATYVGGKAVYASPQMPGV